MHPPFCRPSFYRPTMSTTAALSLHCKYLYQVAVLLASDATTIDDIRAKLATLDERVQAVVAGSVPGRLPPVIAVSAMRE